MPAQEKNMSDTKPKVERFVIYNDVRTLSAEEIEFAASSLYLVANGGMSEQRRASINRVYDALQALLGGENGTQAIMLDTTHEQYEATAHPNNFWR
jgi:hypothetical protein